MEFSSFKEVLKLDPIKSCKDAEWLKIISSWFRKWFKKLIHFSHILLIIFTICWIRYWFHILSFHVAGYMPLCGCCGTRGPCTSMLSGHETRTSSVAELRRRAREHSEALSTTPAENAIQRPWMCLSNRKKKSKTCLKCGIYDKENAHLT